MSIYFLEEKTMDFSESKTKENLARAFAAECQDGARYQFIAKDAKQNQMNYISTILKMLAKNEMAHAKMFYQHLVDNLQTKNGNVNIEAGYPFKQSELKTSLASAAVIEDYEAQNIYPAFAKVAKDEGFPEIAKTFTLVAEVEKVHAQKLADLGEMFNHHKLYKSQTPRMYECSNCGHRETKKEAWKTCPLCNYPQGYVIINFENQ